MFLLPGNVASHEPDMRRADAHSRIPFLPSERDARCKTILQTMCSAPEAVLRFLPEQIGELHPERILPRVTAPILYIGSAAPRFDSQQAKTLLPHLRLEQIPDAGHFLHIYATERVADLVGNFLKPLLRD